VRARGIEKRPKPAQNGKPVAEKAGDINAACVQIQTFNSLSSVLHPIALRHRMITLALMGISGYFESSASCGIVSPEKMTPKHFAWPTPEQEQFQSIANMESGYD
jgi:hypothetical protein